MISSQRAGQVMRCLTPPGDGQYNLVITTISKSLITLVSCPAHSPPSEKRSGEQKLNFLGLFPKNEWDCELVILFWVGLIGVKFLERCQVTLLQKCTQAKEIRLGSPNCLASSGDETNIAYRLTCMEPDIIYMYIHKRKPLQKSVARGEGVVQGRIISQHILSYM